MRKLTQAEFDALTLIGKGRQSAFSRAVAALAVGEALFLPMEEWKKKYHPGNPVRTIAKKYGRKFDVLREVKGTGWVVKRLE
ncbi:MAG: hypothetical protein K9J06_03760 [Flavobacteriales bacterium]|nr:hypothetical protein [Flavobacteriales bacterium]